MKLIHIISAFLLIVNSTFAQDHYFETRVFDCLVRTFEEMGFDLRQELADFEDHLIETGVLADKTGESYFRVFKDLDKTGKFNFTFQHSIHDSIKSKTKSLDYGSINTECADLLKNFHKDKKYKNSRLYQLQVVIDSFRITNNYDLSGLIQKILKRLGPKDFNHEYYKMYTLFMLSVVAHFDSEMLIELPPWKELTFPENMESRNLLIVHVTDNEDTCTINDRKIYIESLVTTIIKYIKSDPKDTSMPELKPVRIDLIGDCYQSQLVISLSNERSTRYDTYIKAFELLKTAYSKARDEKSIDYFGLKFDKLSQQQQDAISLLIPMCLIEKETTR